MGIADLWPILSLVSDDRVSLPVFLTNFLQQHGRPPRLAIDAYMFMFWSQLPSSDVLDAGMERRIIRNFMAKLWYLVQNNVLFVVVFDGKYKPGKLRNGHIPEVPEACSYDDLLHLFKKLHPSSYSEGVSLVESIKRILSRNRLDWVQAPAEAEAECAWLQKLGVVDYVVSDDSDTLVFGATAVLRMFNRVKYFDEENNPVLSSTDYYVTPIYMKHITQRTNLTRDRLVLIAILRGGDYSTGSDSIGITRAKEIALCGTNLLLDLPRKKAQDFGALPDFSQMLVETFLELDSAKQVLFDPFYAMKPALDRSESLEAFNTYLDAFLRKDAKNIFGRMTNFKTRIKIDDYIALLYYFPFVNSKLFKFTPHSCSFGEREAVEKDLTAVNIIGSVIRSNLILSPKSIGKLVFVGDQQIFEPLVELLITKIPLPRERKFNLKPFALRFLRERRFWDFIRLARIRESDGVQLSVLRFLRVKLNDFVYYVRKQAQDQPAENFEDEAESENGVEDDQDEAALDSEFEKGAAIPEMVHSQQPREEPIEDTDKLIEVTIPLAIVKFVAPEFVAEFEKRSPRRSPKKKLFPQKTTLDRLWPGMLPTKDRKQNSERAFEASPTRRKKVEPKKDVPDLQADIIDLTDEPTSQPDLSKLTEQSSPKRLPRRRRGQKPELLAGQSTLNTFLLARRAAADPFRDSLLVGDGPATQTDYVKMGNIMGGAPDLELHRPEQADELRDSSPELSPSKRVRRAMRLSPDSSPIKVKDETREF